MNKKIEELMNLSCKVSAIKLVEIGLIIILVLASVGFLIVTCISISNSLISGMVALFLILLSLFYLFLLLCLTAGIIQVLGGLDDIRSYQKQLKESDTKIMEPIQTDNEKQSLNTKGVDCEDLQPLMIKHNLLKQEMEFKNTGIDSQYETINKNVPEKELAVLSVSTRVG